MVFCWRRRGEERRGKVAQKLFSFAANSRVQESAEKRPGAPFPPIPFVPSVPSIPSIPFPAAHLGWGRGTAGASPLGFPPASPRETGELPRGLHRGHGDVFLEGRRPAEGPPPPSHPQRATWALHGLPIDRGTAASPFLLARFWPRWLLPGGLLEAAARVSGRCLPWQSGDGLRGCCPPRLPRPVPSRPVPSRSPGAGTVGQGGGEVKALTNCKHLVAFFECIYYHISRGV